MAMDDVLTQAFSNVNAPQTATQNAFSSAGNIVNTAMQTDAQLQMHQQTLAMQRAQLQQQYLSKGADLMDKAQDEKTSDKVRPNVINAADQMMQRGGMPPMNPEFKDMFRYDDSIASGWTQAQRAILSLAQDPTNQDKVQGYVSSLGQVAQSGWADSATAGRRLDDLNKNLIAEMGRGAQGSLRLGNSAALDQFKNNQELTTNVMKGEISRAKANLPLPDPSDPTKNFLNSAGQPVTFAQAGNRLAMIQNGKMTPDNTDSQLQTAFATFGGQALADEAVYQGQKKVFQDARPQIAQIPLTGLPKDQQAQIKSFLSAKINEKNADSLAGQANQLLSLASSNKDAVGYNRDLEDKAQSIRSSIGDKIQSYQSVASPIITKAQQMMKMIQDPNSTVANLNAAVGGIISDANNGMKRFADPEVQRVSGLNAWQTTGMKVQSLLGNNPDAPLNQDQRNVIAGALNDTIKSTKSNLLSDLYSQYHTLDVQNGSAVGPKLGAVRSTIQSAIKSNSQSLPASQIAKAYQSAVQAMPGPQYSDQDRKNAMIQHAFQSGYNPIAIDNYFAAKNKRK